MYKFDTNNATTEHIQELKRNIRQVPLPSKLAEKIAKNIDSYKPKIQRDLIILTAMLDYEMSLPILHEKLNSKDERLHFNAAYALSKEYSKQNVPLLSKMLSTENLENWKTASVIMKEHRYPELEKRIKKGIQSEEINIKNISANYLLHHNIASEWLRYSKHSSLKDIAQYYILGNSGNITAKKIIPNDIEDKFIATMLGAAIGDAMGAPVEFMQRSTIEKRYGKITDFVENPYRIVHAGEYTDDTDMSIIVAEALASRGHLNVIDLGMRFAKTLQKILDGEKNRGYAHNTMLAMQNIYAGMHYQSSGLNNSGSGAAIRAHPIGLFYNDNIEELKKAAYSQAILTHNNPEAIGGSIATAYGVAQNINTNNSDKFNKEAYMKKVSKLVKEFSPTLSQELMRITYLPNTKESLGIIPKAGQKGYKSMGVVSSAFFCFINNPRDYLETISIACSTTGDSDSIAAIAGALSGAYNGTSVIPVNLINKLYNSEYIREIGRNLSETCRI